MQGGEINALKVWEALARESEPAAAFYRDRKLEKDDILERGAADFDEKVLSDCAAEKPHYRCDYYASWRGYMDMHIKQNLAALRPALSGIAGKGAAPLLFVDFGCGPMTAGLALAEILSRAMPDYKKHVAYFGVDASKNMVEKARRINRAHKIFAARHFQVEQQRAFDSLCIPYAFPRPRTAILCLSFVLAPRTLRRAAADENAAQQLATAWKTFISRRARCRQTRVIYLNPTPFGYHYNWRGFVSRFQTESNADGFCYTADELQTLPVVGVKRPISFGLIHGKRQ